MKRRRISQREASRNRRELKLLRAFLTRISGPSPSLDLRLGTIEVGTKIPAQMSAASWGANGGVVFVVQRNTESYVDLGAMRVPQEVK